MRDKYTGFILTQLSFKQNFLWACFITKMTFAMKSSTIDIKKNKKLYLPCLDLKKSSCGICLNLEHPQARTDFVSNGRPACLKLLVSQFHIPLIYFPSSQKSAMPDSQITVGFCLHEREEKKHCFLKKLFIIIRKSHGP